MMQEQYARDARGYCAYKQPCFFKEIRKQKHRANHYSVFCHNCEGCSQKTFKQQTIKLPFDPRAI